ncbi:MAG TPA: signal peptidase II [Actinomycetota bacterium]|nr:signal peptidase II [Actinomycetota bacterium]
MTRAPGLYRILLATAAVVVALDQLTKELALDALAGGRVVDVVEGAVSLRLTFNSGGAFGLFQGHPTVFLVATVVVAVAILVWARRVEHRSWAVPLGMVLGGGVGNVVDRVVRDTPGVVDFVDLHVWPVFNLADSCIVTGVALLLWLSARSAPRPADGDSRPVRP